MQKINLNNDRTITDLPRNLEFLCSYYRSISEVCRKLDINRSQFNRYLKGTSVPSTYLQRKICDFFGLEYHEIFITHNEFKNIVSHKCAELQAKSTNIQSHLHRYVDRLQAAASANIERYMGYYFEYYYSMTYPEKILCSFMHISQENGNTIYRRFESLAEPNQQQDPVKCRYEGVIFYLQDRIFLNDHESLTMNEITQTVLYPSFYSKVDFLTGIKLGVSADRDRRILVRNVVLQALGEDINLRECVSKIGLYSSNHSFIPPFVSKQLTKSIGVS